MLKQFIYHFNQTILYNIKHTYNLNVFDLVKMYLFQCCIIKQVFHQTLFVLSPQSTYSKYTSIIQKICIQLNQLFVVTLLALNFNIRVNCLIINVKSQCYLISVLGRQLFLIFNLKKICEYLLKILQVKIAHIQLKNLPKKLAFPLKKIMHLI